MKKFVSMFLTAVLMVSLSACGSGNSSTSQTSDKTSYRVAILKQMDHASLDEIEDAIANRLEEIASEKDVEIQIDYYSGQNDSSMLKQMADQAVSDGVDAIVPIATLAAQTAVLSAEGKNIPVVYAAISDPVEANVTEIDYVTGTSDALNTKQIFDMMFTASPDITKVGLLYSKSEANSAKSIREAKEYLDEKGIDYVEVTATNNDEVKSAASSLIAEGVDTVFTPTDNVIMSAELMIADMFSDAGIAHYTGADSFVRNGAFVTCGVNYTDLGKQTADLAYEAVVNGMSDMEDYYVVDGGVITVNTETSEKLGIDPNVFAPFGEIVTVQTTKE